MAQPARMFSGRIGRTAGLRRATDCIHGAGSVCVYDPVLEELAGCYQCVGGEGGVVCSGPDPTGMITDFFEARACDDRVAACPGWPPPTLLRKCCCYDALGNLVGCVNRPVDVPCDEGCFAPGGALCGGIFDPPETFCPPGAACTICHEGNMPPFAHATVVVSPCTGGCACSCCSDRVLDMVDQINGTHLLTNPGSGCTWSGAFTFSSIGCSGVSGCPSRGCGGSGSFSITYTLTNTVDGVIGTATLSVPFIGFSTLTQNFGEAPATCGGVSGTVFGGLSPCGPSVCGVIWKDAFLAVTY